ncbi:hypothetical protein [Gracilibacillus oryzae]|uniref:hypothetical protein n=1 Tax=Gracilibacillus oryzae TaxID=1672701 RepID=UPI0012964D26|nr:hypothetical protein [Gracilibacillus oryzae]
MKKKKMTTEEANRKINDGFASENKHEEDTDIDPLINNNNVSLVIEPEKEKDQKRK